MKAFLILGDGSVFNGTRLGSAIEYNNGSDALVSSSYKFKSPY